jgi:NhaC family Na+:H+ antiporter
VVLPPLAVIVLAARRIPIKPNLGLGIALGLGLALFFQQRPFPDVLQTVWSGYREPSSPDVLLTLKGGGLRPMINLLLLVLMAGAFNGVMEQTGLMRRLIEVLLGRVKSTVHLLLSTALISVGMAAVACNQALAIIVPARMLRPVYAEKGLPPELLARTLADSGLVVAGLIPWNMLAVLVSASVGVPVFQFAPYAFFLWMLPILTMALAYWTPRRTATDAENQKGSEN